MHMLAQYRMLLLVVATVVLLASGRPASAADLPPATPRQQNENAPLDARRKHEDIPLWPKGISRHYSNDPREWTITLMIDPKDRHRGRLCRIGDIIDGYEIVDARINDVELTATDTKQKRAPIEIVVRSAAGKEYVLTPYGWSGE